jgi:hypothetical protein
MEDNERGSVGVLRQPPRPGVGPGELIGRIVQIALDGTDRGGPLGLVPPLRVAGWAYEKHHYATLGDTVQEICFLGIPLEGFSNPVKVDERLLRATGIRFKSRMPLFQPHFLTDSGFSTFFEQSEEDVVPVDVFVTDSHDPMDANYIADEYNFDYIGEGVLQLFVAQKGFQKDWPRDVPWQDELKAVENWLSQQVR